MKAGTERADTPPSGRRFPVRPILKSFDDENDSSPNVDGLRGGERRNSRKFAIRQSTNSTTKANQDKKLSFGYQYFVNAKKDDELEVYPVGDAGDEHEEGDDLVGDDLDDNAEVQEE